MKLNAPVFLFSLLFSFAAIAQREPTREEEAFFTKAMSEINAKHVQWIKSTAREAKEKNLSPDEVMRGSRSYGVLASLRDPEMEAIFSLAMILMSKDIKEDLKLMMAHLKALKEQKDKITAAIAAVDDKNRSITRARLDSFKLLLKPQPNVKRTNTIPSTREISQVEIDNMRTSLIESRDSLSGMAEEQQLKLQILMDRRSKLMSTLSNLMKKISQTQDSIIANLK